MGLVSRSAQTQLAHPDFAVDEGVWHTLQTLSPDDVQSMLGYEAHVLSNSHCVNTV